MDTRRTAILCSGVTLGVYNPALIVRNKLREMGGNPAVFILETLFLHDKKNKIFEMKEMFHRDFRFALMGQRASKTVGDSYDPFLINELYQRWLKIGINHFIVFSGFWMTILEEYFRTIQQSNYCVDVYHMDAVESKSWETTEYSVDNIQHIWFFSAQDQSISKYLAISNHEIVPFETRYNRYIIHGGGWGIGTYREKIQKLQAHQLNLDIINYEVRDVTEINPQNRYYMMDPNWKSWEYDVEGNLHFPPFGEIVADNKTRYRQNNKYPEVYDLIRRNRGIISKPGGATLLDSLSSATPIIFLEPFGEYERKNAELMIAKGLGIWFHDWEKLSYSTEVIEQCHRNLVKIRAELTEYKEFYKKTFEQGADFNMSIIEKVKIILMEVKSLNVSQANWGHNVSIIDDIGLDSLQIINFLLKIEDRLNIEIDFEEFNYNHLRSLEKFCGFLKENYELS